MDAALRSVRHYLDRARVLVDRADDAALAHRPAPGMMPAGQQLATAIGFAGRAILPLAGREPPAWPVRFDRASLCAYADAMSAALDAVQAADLTQPEVSHRAGFADLTQPAEDYLLRFALPNMIFHLTAGYVGLRAAGVELGKADFDALHAYPAGLSLE